MHPLDTLAKKPISLALRMPVQFGGKSIIAINGTCEGVASPGLLIISEVNGARDQAGADVTNDAKLTGTTVGLRIINIKLIVST